MYTEETKTSINWGSVIKKGIVILLVALVIFFIIWLFARNNDTNFNNNNNNNNGNNIVVPNNKAYSKEYLEGYRYFHDTVKEYFLISELPKEGETLKYTLQELINKGLIFAWEYKDGQTCDTEASYAYVTNVNGQYKLTITLVCGIEVAKTEEELGCNQLCNGNNCQNPEDAEKFITEYRFKQSYTDYETVYSCPSGYIKDGTKCVKSDKNTIDATKNVTYKCPSGYTASGSGENTKCYMTSSSYVDAKKEIIYKCDSGYSMIGSGASAKCAKTTTETISATKTTTYNCPDGYDKSGSGANTKCTKTITSTETKNATAETSYTCSEGTLVNEKYCRIYSTKATYKSYEYYYGKTYNGCTYSGSYTDVCSDYKGCTRTYYKYYCPVSSYKDVPAKETTTYKCPSGYNPSGSGANTKCTKTVTKTDTKNATAETSYKCPVGYVISGRGENTKCSRTTTIYGTLREEIKYSCPYSYQYLINDKCYYSYESTTSPIKNTQYSCQ